MRLTVKQTRTIIRIPWLLRVAHVFGGTLVVDWHRDQDRLVIDHVDVQFGKNPEPAPGGAMKPMR